jgi:hypothetical protein
LLNENTVFGYNPVLCVSSRGLEHPRPHAERRNCLSNPAARKSTIPIVRSVFEKNPWYETRWKAQLEKLPQSERDEMLFMLAARWPDDIRTRAKAESHPPWHYIDFPFKPEGEPASIQVVQPPQENILTAIAENTRILRTGSDPARRGVALTWLSHHR